MSVPGPTRTLVHTWLLLDFFGDSRRSGHQGSSLTTTVFGQSFLALAFAALLFPETPIVPFVAATSSLTVLLVGLGALATADRVGRERADQVLLASAPISPTKVLAARVLHGSFAVCLHATGLALPAGVLLLWLAPPWVAPTYVAASCLLAGIATGALAVVVRVARSVLGEARAWLLAGTLRALVLGFGFVGFALGLKQLRGTADGFFLGRTAVEWLPPYWLARWLAAPADLEWLGRLLGLAVALLVLARFASSSRRPQRARVGASPMAALDRWFARSGPLLGLTVFTSTMLYRSPGFRSRVLPLFGLPAAMTWLAFQDSAGDGFGVLLGMTLLFPAIYLPFLVAFLPRADQEGTGWVFRAAPTDPMSCVHEAALLALSTRVLLPVYIIAWLAMGAAGLGWLAATGLAAGALGIAVLTAALQTRRLPTIPFTDESSDEVGADLGGLMATALPLGLLGALLGHRGLAHPTYALVVGAALLAVAVAFLRGAPRRAAR